MGLRFDPMGGGKFQQAIQKIVEVERQPIKALEGRKSIEEARLKLFNEFKTKVNDLKKSIEEISSIRKLKEYKVDLGDGKDLIEVTVDKEKVQPGVYEMQIDQLAARSGMISSGFDTPDEPVLGLGFIVIPRADGSVFELFVDYKDSSLRNVSSMINKTEGSPVRASVVKDAYEPSKPWKLILTAKDDGLDANIDFPQFYFLDGEEEFWVENDRNSSNAYILLDGFEIDLDSNDVVDFLEGVNVHLRQARPDRPFTMTIVEDHKKIAGKVKAVVDSLNGVLEFINKQNTIDQNSDTSSTFAGDTGLQTIEYRLRNMIHEAFPFYKDEDVEEPELVWLHQMGVQIGKNGLLSFNEDQFTKSMEKSFERVGQSLSGEFGFANQLLHIVRGYTNPFEGLMSVREKALRSRIKQIDNNIEDKERILERRTQSLVDKFSRLQGALANLQQQGSYLSAALNTGGGSNIISQLLGG